MQVYGLDAVIRIFTHFLFIYLAFWALRSLRVDNLFKAFQTTQVRLVIVLLSICLGYTASSFVLEIVALCRNIFVSTW